MRICSLKWGVYYEPYFVLTEQDSSFSKSTPCFGESMAITTTKTEGVIRTNESLSHELQAGGKVEVGAVNYRTAI